MKNMSEEELRKEINKYPKNWMAHYYLGKELLKKLPKYLKSIEEIEKELKRSITLFSGSVQPYGAHYHLGVFCYKLKRYSEAEKEFEKVLEVMPNSVAARYYLDQLDFSRKIPKNRNEIEKMARWEVLESFETNLREFIKEMLEKEYGKNWENKVPTKVRSGCAAKREESLEEERDLPLLYFANFYDYAKIIKENRKIFTSCIENLKDWISNLHELDPIRNAISHSRSTHLSKEKDLQLKKCYYELQKIIKKAKISEKY